MFSTKVFTLSEIQTGSLDRWLNSLHTNGRAVRLVNSIGIGRDDIAMNESYIVVTVVTWKIGEVVPERKSIDEIPEEPTIDLENDV